MQRLPSSFPRPKNRRAKAQGGRLWAEGQSGRFRGAWSGETFVVCQWRCDRSSNPLGLWDRGEAGGKEGQGDLCGNCNIVHERFRRRSQVEKGGSKSRTHHVLQSKEQLLLLLSVASLWFASFRRRSVRRPHDGLPSVPDHTE